MRKHQIAIEYALWFIPILLVHWLLPDFADGLWISLAWISGVVLAAGAWSGTLSPVMPLVVALSITRLLVFTPNGDAALLLSGSAIALWIVSYFLVNWSAPKTPIHWGVLACALLGAWCYLRGWLVWTPHSGWWTSLFLAMAFWWGLEQGNRRHWFFAKPFRVLAPLLVAYLLWTAILVGAYGGQPAEYMLSGPAHMVALGLALLAALWALLASSFPLVSRLLVIAVVGVVSLPGLLLVPALLVSGRLLRPSEPAK